MGKEYNIVIESCISLWLWYTCTVIILDEGINKEIYRRNKEAFWESSAGELTYSGDSQFRKCSCTMWSWLISTARKISREITMREEGVWANDQGSIQQTSNSGQKGRVKNTQRWPSQLRNRSWIEGKSAAILNPQDVHITEAWVKDSLSETSPKHGQVFIKLGRNND